MCAKNVVTCHYAMRHRVTLLTVLCRRSQEQYHLHMQINSQIRPRPHPHQTKTNPAHPVHQLNCRTLFTIATHVITVLRLFVWLFVNLPVRECALCAELTSRFSFLELTFGRMPILTRRFDASTFREVLTRRSIEFLSLASASGISFSRLTSASCF